MKTQFKDPAVILFDVNETLLDLSPLKKKVNKLLQCKKGFQIWFGMLLQHSLVDNSTGTYHDFTSIANATMDMAANALEVNINTEEKQDALKEIKKLHAFADVKRGLKMLKEAGYRLATLTNSPPATQKDQLKFAGLTKYFEQTLSVDAVEKYKPAPECYAYAAKSLGVNIEDILMIAAHGWDIAGAMAVGMQAGFIERKGKSLYPLSFEPQYMGKDLVEVARDIIKNGKMKKDM